MFYWQQSTRGIVLKRQATWPLVVTSRSALRASHRAWPESPAQPRNAGSQPTSHLPKEPRRDHDVQDVGTCAGGATGQANQQEQQQQQQQEGQDRRTNKNCRPETHTTKENNEYK